MPRITEFILKQLKFISLSFQRPFHLNSFLSCLTHRKLKMNTKRSKAAPVSYFKTSIPHLIYSFIHVILIDLWHSRALSPFHSTQSRDMVIPWQFFTWNKNNNFNPPDEPIYSVEYCGFHMKYSDNHLDFFLPVPCSQVEELHKNTRFIVSSTHLRESVWAFLNAS